jgi:DmsE family decaheme c-type cytochrome
MTSRSRTSGPGRALLVAGTLALAFAAQAQEECATCHEDAVKAFAQTSHGRQFAADARHQAADCTSCHAQAREHAASGGETKPVNLKHGPKANDACLGCHAGRRGPAHWQGSAHQAAGVSCAACHDPHATSEDPAPRALPGVGRTTRLCLNCHGGVRAMLHQRSAHPLKDGQMDCAACHDPHGGSGEKLLRQASVNELCHSCHQNMRGPFLWEHSPAREDCLTCHRPHGSNYPQLLQARVTQLCQSCHQQGRHQTVPGLPASIWVGNKACLNCHMQIHGSNHPSGPLFQR